MTSFSTCHNCALVFWLSLGVHSVAAPLRAQTEVAPDPSEAVVPPPPDSTTPSVPAPPPPPFVRPSDLSAHSTSVSGEAARPTEEALASARETAAESSASPSPPAPTGDGVRYELESIEVRGNTRTRSRVILRYLPFRQGKQLDVDDPEFTLARYRLLGTGFFREVEFSLRKGAKRGKVILVVDVTERNSVILNGAWMGLSADANSRGEKRPLTAYGGLDVAETNLAGTGISLGGAVGLAQDQYALRVRFLDPGYLMAPWMVTGTLLHNKAVDFFGSGNVYFNPNESTLQLTTATTDTAVLPYKRFGGSVGLGRDLSVSSQLWLHYRLETITADKPSIATQDGRGQTEPIVFDIRQGRSVFSAIRANFQVDTRDHPFLPTRGSFISTYGELGLAPLGSDYDYQRFDLSASQWWPVAGTSHVFRLQAFAGAMSGSVPFFEQYYVGDFCDFLPARILGLNVDSRPASNFLGTSIESVRYGQYAAQFATEYRVPVYRGHRSVFGIDFFLRGGLFAVAHKRDLQDPGTNYRGFERFPLGATGNFGFRMDTSAGGLVFSFSNVVGFFPMRTGS